MDRRSDKNGPAIEKIGEILKNSIVINEADPKKENHKNTYILLGVGIGSSREKVYVRSIINQSTMQLDDIASFYAANSQYVEGTKKEAGRAITTDGKQLPSIPSSFEISVVQMLDDVKNVFDDVLSLDVMKHFGLSRRETEDWGKRLRYSLRSTDSDYLSTGGMEMKQEHKGVKFSPRQAITYESLVQKPDMQLVLLTDSVGGIDRRAIINKGYENATANGAIGVSGMPAVHVNDIGRDVHVSKRSLGHGLDRRVTDQSAAVQHIGELLKNSVLVNEATAKKESAESSYALLGAGVGEDGSITYVSFVVNRFSNDLERVDVLYSVKTKNRPAVQSTEASASNALSPTDLKISIAEMLSDVKESFSDLLPNSVLDRFGVTRKETEISKYLRYQLRDYSSLSEREILAGADPNTFKNAVSREYLKRYQASLRELEKLQGKLAGQRCRLFPSPIQDGSSRFFVSLF